MGKQCAGTIRLPAALSKQAVFWHGNTAAFEWLETPIFFDLKKARTQTTFPAARRLASGQFLNRLVARLCQMRFRLGRRFRHEILPYGISPQFEQSGAETTDCLN